MTPAPQGPAADPLAWRWLDTSDVSAVWDLHRVALASVPEPGLVKPEDAGFFERMTGADGVTLGGFANSRLVAYGVLQWTLAADDDPRTRFGLTAGTRLAKLAGSSVHPDWRGKGLHEQVITRRSEQALALGYRHLYATTAPGNWRSWTNLLDTGFAVRALVQKYGTLWRFLLHHDPDPPAPGRSALIDPEDRDTLLAWLGKGGRGTGWQRTDPDHVLLRIAEPAS